jgi:hypothetical protein
MVIQDGPDAAFQKAGPIAWDFRRGSHNKRRVAKQKTGHPGYPEGLRSAGMR